MQKTSEHARNAWEARYQSGHTGWDRGGVSPALGHWLDSEALTPCRILVPGCGRGYEVVELARRGFTVTGVDIAPAAIQALTQRLVETRLEATVIQADLLDWAPLCPFEAVYEQTSLCALEPSLWPDYAARLHCWLVPQGRLYALFMQTGKPGGPPYHCALSDMQALFPAARWRWSAAPPLSVPHPAGFHELGTLLISQGVAG